MTDVETKIIFRTKISLIAGKMYKYRVVQNLKCHNFFKDLDK